jgi:DNA-binding IclR family transcriptional regulator
LEEGAALPLDRGAGGHVLRAFTDGSGEHAAEIRAQRFYFSDGERDPEAAAVAVPVFGVNGTFVGALSAVGPRHRIADGRHLEIRDLLMEYAAKLGAELGHR